MQRIWATGDDAITWIEVHSPRGPAVPVANWMQTRNGHITRIRATTDLFPQH